MVLSWFRFGFRLTFRWPFRVSSSTERTVACRVCLDLVMSFADGLQQGQFPVCCVCGLCPRFPLVCDSDVELENSKTVFFVSPVKTQCSQDTVYLRADHCWYRSRVIRRVEIDIQMWLVRFIYRTPSRKKGTVMDSTAPIYLIWNLDIHTTHVRLVVYLANLFVQLE